MDAKSHKIKIFFFLLIVAGYTCFLYKPFLPTSFTSAPRQSKKYVSICGNTFNGRRTGNMMFVLAALLFVANKTQRIPVLPACKNFNTVKFLDIKLKFMESAFLYNNTSVTLAERYGSFGYDSQFEKAHSSKKVENAQVLLICGYFQAIKYVAAVEDQVRERLPFKKDITVSVRDFVAEHKMAFFPNSTNVSTIGMHIRRGDFTTGFHQRRGFAVVDESYLKLAINHHMRNSTSKHHLIFVVSDGISWVKKAFEKISPHIIKKFKVIFSYKSVGFDMCLVSSCDRVIMSSGSFSWWVGLLANTSTVYYSNYPTKDSPMFKKFNKTSYYKSEWVGLPK